MTDVDREQPLVSHLLELRTRLIRIASGILLVFVGLSPFSNPIYTALAKPLTRYMPVSYTHLDVYKRQPIDLLNHCFQCGEIGMNVR